MEGIWGVPEHASIRLSDDEEPRRPPTPRRHDHILVLTST
jgi:hypothetical protein